MIVLDSSAVLAMIFEEPGSENVTSRIDGALISSVNMTEILQKVAASGRDPLVVSDLLDQAIAGIVPFDRAMASATAALWPRTNHAGLSLADRACIALAASVRGIAVTADRSWSKLDLDDVQIHVIR